MRFTTEQTKKFIVKKLWSNDKKGLYLVGATLPDIGDVECTIYIPHFVVSRAEYLGSNSYEIRLHHIVGFELTLTNKELEISHKCSTYEIVSLINNN